MKREYCTQNNGDCETCSLVSYGRDCHNEPLEGIDEDTFRREIARAQTMQRLDAANSNYWIGYQRGLRRAYHGAAFGTPEEHRLWLSLADDSNTMRRQRGAGYRDGMTGRPGRDMIDPMDAPALG